MSMGTGSRRIRLSSCAIDIINARKAGLEGVELDMGSPAQQLALADPGYRSRLKEQMRQTGIKASSVMMALFNACPLASDPRGPAWLQQAIEAAIDLEARTILIAFFMDGDLKKEGKIKTADVDAVVERLKTAAPMAARAGVHLAIENTLTAQQNLEILKRIGHDSVRIYYDACNLVGEGYDVAAEIRLLKDRISCFHFKNGPDDLETGAVKWPPIVEAIKDIGYEGWIVLECGSPTGDRVADDRRNADYTRRLFGITA